MTIIRPSTSIQKASKSLGLELIRSIFEGDGCLLEADSLVNDTSRALIKAMQETHGDVWLGNFNVTTDHLVELKDVLWKWDGSLVYNFGAAFVLPMNDEKLGQMIMARLNAKYEGTSKDSVLLQPIMDRVRELGGELLLWS